MSQTCIISNVQQGQPYWSEAETVYDQKSNYIEVYEKNPLTSRLIYYHSIHVPSEFMVSIPSLKSSSMQEMYVALNATLCLPVELSKVVK